MEEIPTHGFRFRNNSMFHNWPEPRSGKKQIPISNPAGGVRLTWSPADGEPVRWWRLQTRHGKQWATEVLPAHLRTPSPVGGMPDANALSAVDHLGNVSSAATRSLQK